MFRRLTLIITIGALFGIVIVCFHPVNSLILNLALLGCIASVWIGLLILCWNRKRARNALLFLTLVLGMVFFLPGKDIDTAELRRGYVQRLSSYEGTPYFWGGESSRGIDCSGLPRRALRDALLRYGITHANGRALRAFWEQWWFDASAKALGEGYRHYTTPLGLKGTIHDCDSSQLLPGDLAVTRTGTHILAYVGDGNWIQADPGIGFVATLKGRTDRNPWFSNPVTMHRWQILNLKEK